MLPPAEAQEDLEQYLKLLRETHPGLYRYQTQQAFEQKISHIQAKITDSISFYSFYKLLAHLNANIHCSHSFVLPTSNFDNYISRDIKVIPFYFYPMQGKIYVIFSGMEDDRVKPGFELLAINGKSIQEIKTAIRQHVWTDGEIELGKNFALQGGMFQLFYYALIEQADRYQIKFADLNGHSVEIEVNPRSINELLKIYKKNPVNHDVYKRLAKPKQGSWELEILKSPIAAAHLKIPGFGKKNIHSDLDAQAAMRAFMDKTVEKLKKKGVKHLIVDLRDNRGGWDIQGMELLSYLIQEKDSLSYYGPSYAITKDSEFLKYSDLSEYEISQIEKELMPQSDGSFLLNEAYNLASGKVGRKPNAFKGNVYFMVNENTSSAASEFVAIVKSNEVGPLIGTETNGTYGGMNGSSFVKMPLKHSNIFVQTPLVKGQLEVNPIQPLNRGVLPDHEVDFTIQGILEGVDVQLDFTKKIIQTSNL